MGVAVQKHITGQGSRKQREKKEGELCRKWTTDTPVRHKETYRPSPLWPFPCLHRQGR